jgi:cytoskeletal protein CcmA (bactofilin family)
MGIFGSDDTTPDQQPTKKNPKPTTPPPPTNASDRTVIARQSRVEGRVSGACEIIVNGVLTGSIDGSGTVTIAEQGKVEATTHGRTVIISGTVNGDISADEKIELEPSARVDGNITAPRILIRDGASFMGQVNMKVPERRPQLRTSSARKDAGDVAGS